MEDVHERCCGLDIHMRTVVACLLTPGLRGQPQREVRSLSTMTRGLLEIGDWLEAGGCTHVTMESTGSYWRPRSKPPKLQGTARTLTWQPDTTGRPRVEAKKPRRYGCRAHHPDYHLLHAPRRDPISRLGPQLLR